MIFLDASILRTWFVYFVFYIIIKYKKNPFQVVPKAQLLQYHPSDGWEKLCNFLGTPVPDTPFPHVNKGGTVIHDTIVFTPTFQQMKRETFVNLTIVSFIIVVLLLKFLDFFPR